MFNSYRDIGLGVSSHSLRVGKHSSWILFQSGWAAAEGICEQKEQSSPSLVVPAVTVHNWSYFLTIPSFFMASFLKRRFWNGVRIRGEMVVTNQLLMEDSVTSNTASIILSFQQIFPIIG